MPKLDSMQSLSDAVTPNVVLCGHLTMGTILWFPQINERFNIFNAITLLSPNRAVGTHCAVKEQETRHGMETDHELAARVRRDYVCTSCIGGKRTRANHSHCSTNDFASVVDDACGMCQDSADSLSSRWPFLFRSATAG